MTDSRTGAVNILYKMSLDHLIVPESKKVLNIHTYTK